MSRLRQQTVEVDVNVTQESDWDKVECDFEDLF